MVGYFIDRCAGTRGYSGLFLNQWSRCIRIIKCVKVGTSFLLGPHWLINWLNPRFGWLFSLLFFCPVVFAPCEGGLVGRRIWRKDIQLFPDAFLSSSGELTSRAVHGPSSTIPVLLIGKKYEFENVDHAIKIWDTLRYLTRARPEGSTHDSGAGSRINPIPKQFKWKTFENYISSPILSQ